MRGQWNTGVSQATQAIGMGLEERMAKFTFSYADDKPQLNPHVQEGLEPEESGAPDPSVPLTEPSLPLLNGIASRAAKTPNGAAERVKPALPAKGKPRAAKAGKEKQSEQPSLPKQASPLPSQVCTSRLIFMGSPPATNARLVMDGQGLC